MHNKLSETKQASSAHLFGAGGRGSQDNAGADLYIEDADEGVVEASEGDAVRECICRLSRYIDRRLQMLSKDLISIYNL